MTPSPAAATAPADATAETDDATPDATLDYKRPAAREHSESEEWANAITHGLGLLLSLVGGVVGIVAAATTGSPTRVVTVSIFALSLVLLYLASTGFHLSRHPARRLKWRLFDHAAIYALIAGSYTPVLLVSLGGAWGWTLFGIVWTMALVGIAFKTVLIGRYDRFERIDTLLYLAMGWLVLVAIVPLWAALSGPAILLLVLGGLCYSGGCVFFLWDSLPFNHSIWHLFVMAGSAFHYFAVVLHVVPLPAAAA